MALNREDMKESEVLEEFHALDHYTKNSAFFQKYKHAIMAVVGIGIIALAASPIVALTTAVATLSVAGIGLLAYKVAEKHFNNKLIAQATAEQAQENTPEPEQSRSKEPTIEAAPNVEPSTHFRDKITAERSTALAENNRMH